MNRVIPTAAFQTAGAATALVVAASACFGLVPLFARLLLEAGLSAEAIAFYRFAFSALVVLPFMGRIFRRRGQAALVFGAGLVMGLGWMVWVQALDFVPVASAGVVYMSYPMFTIILARLLVGQAISGRAMGAAVLILAAALALAPSAFASGQALDLLRCLPAPIAFAFIIVVLSSMARDLGTLERMGCGMLGAVVGLLPMVLSGDVESVVPATGDAWLLILAMGAVTAAVPQMIYTFATAIVGPSRSAAAGSIELPTMMAIGWLAFGEAVGWPEALAAALVIAAIAIAPAVGGATVRPLERPRFRDRLASHASFRGWAVSPRPAVVPSGRRLDRRSSAASRHNRRSLRP